MADSRFGQRRNKVSLVYHASKSKEAAKINEVEPKTDRNQPEGVS